MLGNFNRLANSNLDTDASPPPDETNQAGRYQARERRYMGDWRKHNHCGELQKRGGMSNLKKRDEHETGNMQKRINK
jgi:hypothetical protein